MTEPDADSVEIAELKRWLDENRAVLLLDVLPAEAHEEWRIPGSRNACVYEVAFEEKAGALGAPRGRTVVVYGSGPRCRSAADAAARLRAAGWQDVKIFQGGREEWSDAGLPAEGSAAGRPWEAGGSGGPEDGRYAVDTERSLLHWTGRNAANSHWGRVRLAGGWLRVEGGSLTGGEAVADMKSVTVDDLEGDLATALVRHLATADFFLVERWPTATFRMAGAEEVPGAAPGQPNLSVHGELEVRGKRAPLAFAAWFAPAGPRAVALQCHFDFDRTRWGSRYGSGKLYDRLGMHLVNDHVTMQARVVAALEPVTRTSRA